MKVDEQLLLRVAQNARLALSPAEVQEFLPEIQELLTYFSMLDEVDVSAVGLTLQPVVLQDVLREDVVEESLSQEEALANTTQVSGGYFVGPKTL